MAASVSFSTLERGWVLPPAFATDATSSANDDSCEQADKTDTQRTLERISGQITRSMDCYMHILRQYDVVISVHCIQ
jgi:hypothetical protein